MLNQFQECGVVLQTNHRESRLSTGTNHETRLGAVFQKITVKLVNDRLATGFLGIEILP